MRIRKGVVYIIMDDANIGITPQEMEIIKLLKNGLTSQEVALKIQIKVSTVRTYERNLHSKLEVGTRTELLFVAEKLGLLR